MINKILKTMLLLSGVMLVSLGVSSGAYGFLISGAIVLGVYGAEAHG